jgi:Fic-DOC domain mobile mystery protein B
MSESDVAPWRTEHEPEGATPLSEDEKEGLRLSWVATRGDLNAAEAANIAKALRMRKWYGYSTEVLLDDHVLRQLHAAMFGDVWRWAGKYRTTEKNIGADPDHIAMRVRDLCEDAKYWFQEATAADGAGCRFHHALVVIHPFANGNGRHARAVTDLLMRSVEAPPFTWGSVNFVQPSETRRTYIAALQAADRGNLEPLAGFVRS